MEVAMRSLQHEIQEMRLLRYIWPVAFGPRVPLLCGEGAFGRHASSFQNTLAPAPTPSISTISSLVPSTWQREVPSTNGPYTVRQIRSY